MLLRMIERQEEKVQEAFETRNYELYNALNRELTYMNNIKKEMVELVEILWPCPYSDCLKEMLDWDSHWRI